MTALDNLMNEIEVIEKPLSPEVQPLIKWLEKKYAQRLKIYPGILSDPVFQHTRAAKRLRVLGAAIEILQGGRYLPHIKLELIEDLREEKNALFERMGKVTASSEFYQKIIDHLLKMNA
jgi:hypothetical protein